MFRMHMLIMRKLPDDDDDDEYMRPKLVEAISE
jgi:hypothetical protein